MVAPEDIQTILEDHPPALTLKPERARQCPKAGTQALPPIRRVKALAEFPVRVQVILILAVNVKDLP